jgi:ABC-type antimicrobial peptide transport system ATPase subunit
LTAIAAALISTGAFAKGHAYARPLTGTPGTEAAVARMTRDAVLKYHRVDVSVQATVLNLLLDLQEEFGLTYVFISHDLAVVKYMADDILVMSQGEIVERGTSEEIYSKPRHAYTRQLLDAIPRGYAAALA